MLEMKTTLSSQAKKIVRNADDLHSRGTCSLPAILMQWKKCRSLHGLIYRRSRSIGLVGMTEFIGRESTGFTDHWQLTTDN
jgi:hypothetical protein